MTAILNGDTLTLSGDVGDFYFDDHFTYTDVVLALAQVAPSSTLTVHVNSGGGYATEGAAIHALFSARPGRTDFVVEGVAASAASLIVMAGDTVTMTPGSVLMIHDPSVFTGGTADDLAKTIEGLEALATSYARVYADKSGKTADECRAIMRAERWYAPDDAVAEGFADQVGTGSAAPVAAFDYRAYAHAPSKLTALAKRKNWSLAEDRKPPAHAPGKANLRTKETTMPPANKPGEDATAQARRAATARLKSILSSATATDQPKLAEHLAYETDMDLDAAEAIMQAASHGRPDIVARGGQGGIFLTDAELLTVMRTGRHPKDPSRQQLNGERLNGGYEHGNPGGASMADRMRERHGVQKEGGK